MRSAGWFLVRLSRISHTLRNESRLRASVAGESACPTVADEISHVGQALSPATELNGATPAKTSGKFGLSRIGFFLIATSLAFSSPRAEAPPSTDLQVGHDYWTSKDGAPGDIQTLAQTNDGFLWLGGPSGLFRFDGTRFERFKPPLGDRLLSTNVMALLAPPSGGLWVGYTFGGFSFLDNGHVRNYALDVPVRYLARDRNGTLWAATSAGLWKFDGAKWQQVGAEWNAPAGAVFQIAFDSEGTLWVLAGVDFGAMDLFYMKAGTRRFLTAAKSLLVLGFTFNADGEAVTEPEPGPLLSGSSVDSDVHLSSWPVLRKDSHQIVDRNNSVWVAPKSPAVVMRLPSKGRLYDTPSGNSETWDFGPFPFAKLVDREGNIWFGEIKGLHRFWYSPFHKLELPKTVAGNTSFALAPDDHGSVWMSVGGWYTSSVLIHTSGGTAEPQTIPAEIHAPFAHRAPDGTFWFIGNDCLLHLVGRSFVRVSLPPEIANQASFLQAITEDQRGAMWVSFKHYGLYRLAGGVWTGYGGYEQLRDLSVLTEFTDSMGRVWLGCIKNQLVLLSDDHVRLFGASDGLRLGNITAVHGRGRRIWIGGEFGLAQVDDGHVQNMSAVNDEWLRGISGIVETSEGDLWLNGLSGIFHISKTEIAEAVRNTSYRLKGDHFSRRDGLPGVPTQLNPLPTAIEGTDGRLWFALQNGVVWLDPATYSDHRGAPPAITIESVSADDKGYAPASSLSFPARTSSVLISYAAVSLSDPEAIRFRYKLPETDEDWHEVAAATPVTYRNLPPGSYHFNVTASDTNGIWSNKVATADFTILPAFYQTWWFRSLCAITFAALLAGLYRVRLSHLTGQYNIRLEERVNERTRIARELHDTLLQSSQASLIQMQAARNLFARRPEQAVANLDSAINMASGAIAEGREAIQQLRIPAAQGDLPNLLNVTGQELARSYGTWENAATFRVLVQGEKQELEEMLQDEIYRIASELLRNAFQHAEASQIEAEVRYEQRFLRVDVRDNGKGIETHILSEGRRAGHWGLPGITERAKRIGAQLDFWSGTGQGTKVQLTVPASVAYRGNPTNAGIFRYLLKGE